MAHQHRIFASACVGGTHGEVLTREHLFSSTCGNSVQIADRAIDAQFVRLRKKLGDATANEDLIRTVHGVGYKLAALVI
ncbi:helix-turn-helix domain-containing protein [Roseobacter sp.]|uniref:winged helix-turn-helix domain-containing protein n=1 Tax=Roseobacter sp. TaxID=1907202 RepID=UPI003863A7A7